MGITAHSRITRLENEIKALSSRLPASSATVHRLAKPNSSTTAPTQAQPKPASIPIKGQKAARAKQSARTAQSDHISAKLADSSPAPSANLAATHSSFEEKIGAQWSVWVGGLALAIGALFLLRYTIEAGVFSPPMRVSLAAIFGTALLGAGEWLRRKDGDITALPAALTQVTKNAYIPGVLTAVGILALLGASYAAYGLYNFIGPLPAFILMGSISLGGLFLGALHGPKIAGLGLLASLATPLLITSKTPQYFPLFLYLIIVGGAALTLAQRRHWGWLNYATLFGSLAWGLLSLSAVQQTSTFIAWGLFITASFATNIWIALKSEDISFSQSLDLFGKQYNVWASYVWTICAAALVYIMAAMQDFTLQHFGIAFAAALGMIALGALWPRLKWKAIIGGLLSACLIFSMIESGSQLPNRDNLAIGATLISFITILLTSLKYIKSVTPTERIIWALFSTCVPLFTLLNLLPTRTDINPNTASALLAAASLVFLGCAEWLWRGADKKPVSMSIYIGAAALAYIAAIDIAFIDMTQSIALIAPIIICALLYRQRPIWALRPLAVLFAGLSLLHSLVVHLLPSRISETLILNELWIYLAVPAALSAGAAWALSRSRDDLWSEGMKAFALCFTALFLVFQIRHIMNNGVINRGHFGFDEMSLHVLIGFSVSLGGSIMGRGRHLSKSSQPYERLLPYLSSAISCISLALFAFGICLLANPLLSANTTLNGGYVINSLLLAYLLPAILLGAVTFLTRNRPPAWYPRLTGALSLIAGMIYVTSMVRRGFNDAQISVFKNTPSDPELYTISAVWLICGIAVLALGIRSKRLDVRAASAVIIVLTVFKAFLIDMASLEGVLRAVSFVVLGLVLIVIGRVYQRFMFSKASEAKET